MSTRQLCFAYGSNLNISQMQARCPDALPVGPLNLPNAVLRFRGVADVAYLRGATCPGGLWEISSQDEQELDAYEGVCADPQRGLYQKLYLTLSIAGREHRCLYYMMNQLGIMPPSQPYLDSIAQGYRDFGLDLARLQRALDHSHQRRRKTPALRARWRRKGMPRMAVTI